VIAVGKQGKPAIAGKSQFVDVTGNVEVLDTFSVGFVCKHDVSLRQSALASNPPVAPVQWHPLPEDPLKGRPPEATIAAASLPLEALAGKPPVAPE